MHVFIDTNILLNFFHFSKDDLSTLGKIFSTHEDGTATVYVTGQVSDEFRRNRETKINDALKRFKESIPKPQFPSFMKEYAEYELIKGKANEIQDVVKLLQNKVMKDISECSLLADKLMENILGKSDLLLVTSEIYEAAVRRMASGNPPGKDRSIGDALNWILLLSAVPEGQDLHLISEDGDFYSVLDDTLPHGFISHEWTTAKKSKLFVYRTISAFIKEHFDGVAFTYDTKKSEAIDALRAVGSFAGAHFAIAELEQFSYFSLKETERILIAISENNQIGGICTDRDISDFILRISRPLRENLLHPQIRELLKTVIEDRDNDY